MKQKLIIDDITWNLNTIIYKCKRHWAIYSSEKKRWKDKIIKLCKEQKLKKVTKKCTITLTYTFPDKRRRDPDNLTTKFLLDGLVCAKILKDDSFKEIKEIRMKAPKIKKGIKQTIIEMEW